MINIPYYWMQSVKHYFELCQSWVEYQRMMYGAWRNFEKEFTKTMQKERGVK